MSEPSDVSWTSSSFFWAAISACVCLTLACVVLTSFIRVFSRKADSSLVLLDEDLLELLLETDLVSSSLVFFVFDLPVFSLVLRGLLRHA